MVWVTYQAFPSLMIHFTLLKNYLKQKEMNRPGGARFQTVLVQREGNDLSISACGGWECPGRLANSYAGSSAGKQQALPTHTPRNPAAISKQVATYFSRDSI